MPLIRRTLSAGPEMENNEASSFKNPETRIPKIGNDRIQDKIANTPP